jgi:hypothetical protein
MQHYSVKLFVIAATSVTKMILELLHQRVYFAPGRPPSTLQDKTVYYSTEDDTGQETNHEPIGEHLIGHAFHLLTAAMPSGKPYVST